MAASTRELEKPSVVFSSWCFWGSQKQVIRRKGAAE
jgi:hypothetical protein